MRRRGETQGERKLDGWERRKHERKVEREESKNKEGGGQESGL